MSAMTLRYLILAGVVAVSGCGVREVDTPHTIHDVPASEIPETADEKTTPPTKPDNASAALDRFQSQALASLPRSLATETRQFVVDTINDRQHLSAQRVTCQSCFERIDSTLTPKERKELILMGSIKELRDHRGGCWEVNSFGGFGSGISGYLETDTGKLLLLWIVPEG